ncbi:MAG: four helix bundle protein [Candidatus Cloacimonetes bacterium]|nr:four helix bundle protein [Candidatus Cloacimonadota bacterium]
MKENVVKNKSFDFAVETVKIYKHLIYKKKEYVLSKQLLRSGTSIGANVEEATAAQSRRDFISKMSIASKECRETLYWIKLLTKTNYIKNRKYKNKCEELVRILTSIVKTTSERKNEN